MITSGVVSSYYTSNGHAFFTLTDDAVRSYDTNTKMNPPLRSRDDVEAMRHALKDGTIDVIATDHAPHSYDEK